MGVDVSVLTPVFNGETFVRDAIDSVLGQSESLRIEHIVQDGASTDGTVAAVEERTSGAKVLSEPDCGQSDGLNRALRRAEGTWIAWLNADEFYLPDALENLVTEGLSRGADVVYGDGVIVDSEGALMRLVPQHSFSRFVLRSFGPYIDTSCVLIRRDILDGLEWDTRLQLIMDWDLFLRLEEKSATFVDVLAPVAASRRHESQATKRLASRQALEYEILRNRHAVPPNRFLREIGRTSHGIKKIQAGAYRRQTCASHLRGQSLRWFASSDARGACRSLQQCYRSS